MSMPKLKPCRYCGKICGNIGSFADKHVCADCRKKRKDKPFYPNVERKGSCRFD